jgi:hypothetical protein
VTVWRCPYCRAHGRVANVRAAYLAGVRHFLETHDHPEGVR